MVTRTGIDQIKEHPPSSRRVASAHWALAFRLVRFPEENGMKKSPFLSERASFHGEAESATSELFAWMASVTSFRENVSVPSLKL